MHRSLVAAVTLSVCIATLWVAEPARAQAAQSASPPACETPEHRQFDFWVGDWQVSRTGQDQVIARSLIEKLHAGCVVRESWRPANGAGGTSLNSWRPLEGKWRQVWADGSNGFDSYVGGLEGGAMVLTAETRLPDGSPALARMRFTREADGSVRQVGTRSTDEGESWQPQYDFTYRPVASD